MERTAKVEIHCSQFPERIQADLLESLRARRIDHKFHYESREQARLWLALHEAHSPARSDPDTRALYERCFDAVPFPVDGRDVHVISLGSGGGQKDLCLLRRLAVESRRVDYTPVDVSLSLALISREAALSQAPAERCHPVVCDLGRAEALPDLIAGHAAPDARRVILFFGMLPNFEPGEILPKLSALLRPGDGAYVGTNLAPGDDYDAGLRQILPQYDNPATREWLTALPRDLGLGIEPADIRFEIAVCPGAPEVKRVEASVAPPQDVTVKIGADAVDFRAGEPIRLFYSCRYTAPLLESVLQRHGVKIEESWIAPNEEEGVFRMAKVNV